MIVKEDRFSLKNGKEALLRCAEKEDAEKVLSFFRQASGETDFLLKYPEELTDYTVESEEGFICSVNDSPSDIMLICTVEGDVAGSCRLTFNTGLKTRHRASIAVAVLKEYWSLGIGTRMLRRMEDMAKKREGVTQLELDFIEGNSRAEALYEKEGYIVTGAKKNAIRFSDGRIVDEYMMIKIIARS